MLLQVREADIQEVMAVLEQEYMESTSLVDHDITNAGAVFDTNAAQATCPACGYQFSTDTLTCPDCGLCFG
ncbi:MAG: hypothetical protein CSB34_02440 [Desulfobulbus propionicus]|nr:MAG: hypothetical protein CSB34_02440 [Desulfobulbus propionicus]